MGQQIGILGRGTRVDLWVVVVGNPSVLLGQSGTVQAPQLWLGFISSIFYIVFSIEQIALMVLYQDVI